MPDSDFTSQVFEHFRDNLSHRGVIIQNKGFHEVTHRPTISHKTASASTC